MVRNKGRKEKNLGNNSLLDASGCKDKEKYGSMNDKSMK